MYLFRHNASYLTATFIPSLQHILVGITRGGLLLRKLKTNVFFTDGRTHGIAHAWATARTEHEVRSKLRAPRRAQNITLFLLLLLGGKGGKAGGSEGLRLRTRVMNLWLRTVEVIGDLSLFVTILSLFNILPHRTKVGSKTVEITGEACGAHRRGLAMSGRWFRCSGGRVNRGTRLEDRGISRKIRSGCLWDGHGSGASQCASCKWRSLIRRRCYLQVGDDSLQRGQSIARLGGGRGSTWVVFSCPNGLSLG